MKRITCFALVPLAAVMLFTVACKSKPNDSGANSGASNSNPMNSTSPGSSPAPNSEMSNQSMANAKPGSQVAWARYDDPAENSFSLEAPQGWDVQGGMFRFGYFDVRWMIDARSPDGRIILRLADANIPGYALPSPHTPPEGQAFIKPQQFQMVVSRYQDGQVFAEKYGRVRFQSVCRDAKPQPATWKLAVPALFRGTSAREESEGAVSYTCETSAGPRTAIIYVRTSSYDVPGGGFWQVEPVVSILATSDSLLQAEAIAQHMFNSFARNPEWEQFQSRMVKAGAAQVGQQYRQFLGQMQAYHQARTNAWNQQVAGFEARQAASQAQSSRWGDILTGLTDAVDPQSGTRFQVWTGPYSNYYRNGAGQVVNANTSPGPGYHQVQTPAQ